MTERGAEPATPVVLFVLGMHRSGTSAIAGTIRFEGLSFGRVADHLPVQPENPKGYWESGVLTQFNEDVLSRFGGSWSAPPLLPADWPTDPRLDGMERLGRALVETVYPTAPWGWKDPRNSLLLPYWRRVLDVRPVVVLAHRNPLEVADSLWSWRGLDKPLALALWERYARSALSSARGLPTLVVPYAGLLADPACWRATLTDFLSRQGIAARAARGAASRSFLEDNLRHSVHSPEEFLGDASATEEQRALFRVFEQSVGEHSSFDVPPPPESPATQRMFTERSAAGLDGDREERRLRRSIFKGLESVNEGTELDVLENPVAYRERLDRERPAEEARALELRRAVESGDRLRTVSVVCAVDGAHPKRLGRAIASLREQIDARWRLSIVLREDDADCRRVVEAAADSRITLVDWPRGAGRAAALDAAIASTDGDLVTFLDPDDRFSPTALAEIRVAADARPDAGVLYADEDRIDDAGDRSEPFFKPDWSPDYLSSCPYLGRPLVIRRSLLAELGSLSGDSDGAEDYDLMLRASERSEVVLHLPKVLYHRGGRGALETLPPAAGRKVLAAAMARRGQTADVVEAEIAGGFRVQRAVHGRPRVTIVVPFRDEPVMLERCLRSIHELGGHDHWEALLVDHRSWQPETKALLRRIADDPRCRVLAYDAPFNWSAMNNRAVAEATGELLLFLNNDVEGGRPGWLTAMIEHAERPEIGAVGARLLYPNGMVQHAGIVLHRQAVARHPFRFLAATAAGYFGMARLVRNVTAVTGACMMVRRDVFREVGGFDERLPVAFNDVDFCLRALERGYRIVYTPYAELTHHEGLTRGMRDEPTGAQEMFRRWAQEIESERFMSPSLGWRRARIAVATREDEP